MGGPGFEAIEGLDGIDGIDGLDGIDGIEGIEPMDAKAPAGSATAALTSTASTTRPFNGRFLTTTPFTPRSVHRGTQPPTGRTLRQLGLAPKQAPSSAERGERTSRSRYPARQYAAG